ncbi:MAG: hypothetical protein IPP77_05975 [Bacteroidetes bacterium]|nr:hypothetical protein [Bacteroidota bacterium]
MKFSGHPVISYKDIYGEIVSEQFADLFKDIPTNVVIEIVSNFMAKIHTEETSAIHQEEIVKNWIERFPNQDRNEILEKLSEFDFIFFNNVSSLFFIEHALLNFQPHREIDDLTPKEEYQLFRAYLKATQEWTEAQHASMNVKAIKDTEDFIKLILPAYLPYYEFRKFKTFWIELAKAIYFFKFIERDNKLGPYLNDFLTVQKVATWEEYLFRLTSMYIQPFILGRKSVLIVDDKDDETDKFLENIVIEVSEFKKEQDFLKLRLKPVYKLSNRHFSFFNFNFLVDKIFQSIQFDFATILKNKGVVKGLDEFKTTYYSEEFAEKYFLNEVVPYLIGKRDRVISLNGDKLANQLGAKGPDYYLRCGTKIFVIELKDILISAKVKWSLDFDVVKDEILRKLMVNERGKPKGITQLVNFITTFKKDGFFFDKLNIVDANIYPILICTDDSLNAFGVNRILTTEFRTMLRSHSIPAKVNDPILIHIDTIIQYQDIIHDKKIPVAHLFNAYIDFVTRLNKWDEIPFHWFISFKDFLPKYLYDKGIRVSLFPRSLGKVLSEIIKEK